MSTPSADPAEGSDTSSTPGSGTGGTPTAQEPAVTPPAAEPEETPAAKEPAARPPVAELFVPPVAEHPSDTIIMEEEVFPQGAAEEPPVAVAPQPAWAQLIRRATFGQAVVIVTGVLLFVWSFLPWYGDAGGSANAWSTVTIPGLVMTATWIPVLSLAIVIFVVIKVFGDGFPDTVLGFSWAQLCIVVGLFDVLISLGFLVANTSFLHLGAGLILSFITSLVLLAGAVADHLGIGTETLSRLRPPEARRDRP